MENSYRFLMMAATILLAIMILSIFVYVFRAGARANRAIDDAQREQQLVAENAKFEHYNKNDNTVSDMVSLINLVHDYNESRDWAPDDCITLKIYLSGSVGEPYIYIDDSCEGLGRNEAKFSADTSKPISVYQLASETAETDHYFNGKGTCLTDKDNFSITKYDNSENTTIYKYIFQATHPSTKKVMFTYDNSSRVKTMTFYVQQNEKW